MSTGAILQLVANDIGGPVQRGSRNAVNNAMDIITHNFHTSPLIFHERNQFTIQRVGDVIKSIYFQFKMAALPSGWIYKNKWTNHAFEELELVMGGMSILKKTKDHAHIANLIFPADTDRHLCFDYTLEERRQKSLQTHETIYQFDITDIFGDHGIPLVALTYHEVSVRFKLSDLSDCIERDPLSVVVIPPVPANIIISCTPQSEVLFLEHTVRRQVTERPQEINSITYGLSNIVTAGLSEEDQLFIRQSGICSSAYIHITNEDGSEIAEQVLADIEVRFSGMTRFALTAFQCRQQVRQWLPHATRENDVSQNLYYISYHTSPYNTEESGSETEGGLNLNRIDRYTLCLTYNRPVEERHRMKISIMHRMHNTFITSNGLGGLRRAVSTPVLQTLAQYEQYNSEQQIQDREIRSRLGWQPRVTARRSIHDPAVSGSVAILHTSDTTILIIPEDAGCIITMEPIVDDTDVVQCQQCMKIATLAAMNEWFTRSKTCPCCRGKHMDVQFVTGKAKINILI